MNITAKSFRGRSLFFESSKKIASAIIRHSDVFLITARVREIGAVDKIVGFDKIIGATLGFDSISIQINNTSSFELSLLTKFLCIIFFIKQKFL